MQQSVEIHTEQPVDFNYSHEVVAMLLEVNGELLMLHYADPFRPFWTAPGGKAEKGETPRQACLRELFEETGIDLDPTEKIIALETLYVQLPKVCYIYYPFFLRLESRPNVTLSKEHTAYVWVTPEEAIQSYPLIPGGEDSLRSFLKIRNGDQT